MHTTPPYTQLQVKLLRGSLPIELPFSKRSALLFRKLLSEETNGIKTLGALSGNQSIQLVRAGMKAIYCSGWQVAADANSSGEMYPDQSLYPVDSMPKLVKSIVASLRRADEIEWLKNSGVRLREWYIPIIADAEAGFGGNLNTFELVKSLIREVAAGIHLEDQLSSAKKCGHLGGKVLVPTSEFINKLISARLAADVLDIPTVIIARTDAVSAKLLTRSLDDIDKKYIVGQSQTREGFYHISGGFDMAIDRALTYAPYCDMLWCETSTPNLQEAEKFAKAIHSKYPGKWLAYNCSPSFNWQTISTNEAIMFQNKLVSMGYIFQFVTLAGFHTLNYSMFDLASHYSQNGMGAYQNLQLRESKAAPTYTAVKHQSEVGTEYYDAVASTIESETSTTAYTNSTESTQFNSKL